MVGNCGLCHPMIHPMIHHMIHPMIPITPTTPTQHNTNAGHTHTAQAHLEFMSKAVSNHVQVILQCFYVGMSTQQCHHFITEGFVGRVFHVGQELR